MSKYLETSSYPYCESFARGIAAGDTFGLHDLDIIGGVPFGTSERCLKQLGREVPPDYTISKKEFVQFVLVSLESKIEFEPEFFGLNAIAAAMKLCPEDYTDEEREWLEAALAERSREWDRRFREVSRDLPVWVIGPDNYIEEKLRSHEAYWGLPYPQTVGKPRRVNRMRR